jgi:hypothetical protein
MKPCADFQVRHSAVTSDNSSDLAIGDFAMPTRLSSSPSQYTAINSHSVPIQTPGMTSRRLRIKRVNSPELRDQVYALRYRAYRSENAIPVSRSERFFDDYDGQPNHVTFALMEGPRLVGSIRGTWFDPGRPEERIPEMERYASSIQSIASDGCRLLSGNRFVIDPQREKKSHLYAFLLLRQYMLLAHGRADVSLAAVRKNHLPFYKRVLNLSRLSDAMIYPGLTCEMYLTACRFQENIESVYQRYPILKPVGYERVLLDHQYQDIWEVGLPVETF